VADRYGLEALVPKARRSPQMPEATPTHVVEALLTLAVTMPTIGCRQYADRLGDQCQPSRNSLTIRSSNSLSAAAKED
jgi:hypothetical protein